MKKGMAALAWCMCFTLAHAEEAPQPMSILDVDCNLVIGKPGAKERCFERQRLAKVALNPDASEWSYTSPDDGAQAGKREIAALRSINTEVLEATHTRAKGVIVIEGKPTSGEYDIILRVEDGELYCKETLYEGQCAVGYSVGGKASILFAERPDNNKREFVLSNASGLDIKGRFLAELRKGEEMIIEFPMYELGYVRFTFNTFGLNR